MNFITFYAWILELTGQSHIYILLLGTSLPPDMICQSEAVSQLSRFLSATFRKLPPPHDATQGKHTVSHRSLMSSGVLI